MSLTMQAIVKEALFTIKHELPAGKYALIEYNVFHMPVSVREFRKNKTLVATINYDYDNNRKLMTAATVFADASKKPKVLKWSREEREQSSNEYPLQFAV